MSEPLPLLSGSEIVTALGKIGYYIRRQRGSHIRLYHDSRQHVTVPNHEEVDRRTLKGILRTANLTPEEFKKLL